MNEIKKKYTCVSLGSNCFIKKYLSTISNQETHFFDYIGAPMWAINEIVESDFVANMYDQKDYDILVTKRNDKLVVHKKYFLVFQHDLQPGYTEKQFISNKEK
jgi:hypothetical protein